MHENDIISCEQPPGSAGNYTSEHKHQVPSQTMILKSAFLVSCVWLCPIIQNIILIWPPDECCLMTVKWHIFPQVAPVADQDQLNDLNQQTSSLTNEIWVPKQSPLFSSRIFPQVPAPRPVTQSFINDPHMHQTS